MFILCLLFLLATDNSVAAAASPTASQFISQPIAAQPIAAEHVELFDTDKEQVVHTVTNSDAFQQEATKILASVTSRVAELNPPLEHSMIVKIPLAPPQKLSVPTEKIDATIGQMFVIMPKHKQRKPWLILHTKGQDMLVLEFAGSVEKLRQMVNL